ncbi:MAG: DUF4190 domain-containing protein [Planctomycetaceae bacterium]|nr:DUF4190 domain-containing protein [Planctomycetaceae bacterium]
MECSKCGAQNPDGAMYCVNCGQILPEPTTAQPQDAGVIQPRNSGFAVASFVMGLLSLLCVTWPLCGPLAIIFGIVALVKISQEKPYLKGAGMAVAGIAIPAVMLVLIPIIAIPLAILMPAFSRAKDAAQRTACASNLNALSVAITVYRNDYDGNFPPAEQWCDLLMREADVPEKSFQCPKVCGTQFAYAINKNLYQPRPGLPPETVVLFESDLGKNAAGGPENVAWRHGEQGKLGCNIAFADNHVEFVTADRVPELLWTPE